MSDQGEVILEFINIGNVVKVTAVCAKTGREVSIVGNPKASKQELQNVAVRKLRYVLSKEKESSTKKGSGIIV